MAETVEQIIAATQAHADTQAPELKPESDVHALGIVHRLYRLEALLNRASKYVPRFDDDGHLLPLKQAIDSELKTMVPG